jgi:hypothetical protein
MKKTIAVLPFFLAGCATSVTPVITTSGKVGLSSTCSAFVNDSTSCFEAVSDACGGVYTTIERRVSVTPPTHGAMVRYSFVVIAECKFASEK